MPDVDPGFLGKGGRRAGGNKTFSSVVEMAIAPLRASCHRQSSMAKTAALNHLPGLQKRVREREAQIERLRPSSLASDKQPVKIAALRMRPRIDKEFTRMPLP